MQTEVTRLSFHPAVPYAALAALGAGLIVLTLLGYSRTHRELPKPTKVLLILLRIFVLLIILLCLTRPSLTRIEIIKEPGWVLLLLDNSRSMLIKDLEGGATRAEVVMAGLSQNQERLKQVKEQYPKHFVQMLVGRETTPWTEGEPDWSDKSTAIGTALESAHQIARGKKMAGVLLFSDGANNFGPEPVQTALALRELAAPLYVFGVGKQEGIEMRDAKTVDVLAPKRVFSGNKFPIDAELHFLGMVGETADVVFKFDGQEIHRAQVAVKSSQDVARVRHMHSAVLPGTHRISVEVPPMNNEISDRNNSESTYIDILTGGLNVLYLEGKLRPEFGFVRRSIEAAPNLALTIPLPFHISTRPRMARFLKKNDLNKFHVFIIGDLPAKVFPAGTLESIKRMVGHQSAGLAMLGGYDSYGAGGYATTPLADVLPVQLASRSRQEDQPTRIVLTNDGLSHFMMTLESEPRLNREAWESLPRLKGLTLVGLPKPAATVLALSETRRPMVVVQEYGKGRTAALTGDTTFRWVLGQPPETAIHHKRFWRQVILWLASRDKLGEKALLLSVEKFSYRFGETTRIIAEVMDEKGNAVTDAEVKITVQLEDSEDEPKEVPTDIREEHYEANYAATEDGVYMVRATATSDGEAIGQKETRFRLTVPDREFNVPHADLKLLRKIADASNGGFYGHEDLGEVLQEILDKKLATEIRREHHDDIWNSYPMLALFLVPLLLEWIIRRRKGLV